MRCLPIFFRHIELRNGFILNDPLLKILPAIDLSTWIFGLIWISILYTLFRTISSPTRLLEVIYSIVFIISLRFITLILVPLNPPAGLIPINDPISSLCYGGHSNFLTKDLFFSGHTSTLFICFLLMKQKWEKVLFGIGTFLIATFVLIQHVHYTIDVIAAPFFTYFANFLAKKITVVFGND